MHHDILDPFPDDSGWPQSCSMVLLKSRNVGSVSKPFSWLVIFNSNQLFLAAFGFRNALIYYIIPTIAKENMSSLFASAWNCSQGLELKLACFLGDKTPTISSFQNYPILI